MLRIRKTDLIPALLSLPFGLLAGVAARYAVVLPWQCDALMSQSRAMTRAFAEAAIPGLATALAFACGVCGAVFFVGAFLALVRRGWALRAVRLACFAAYVLVLFYAYAVLHTTGVIARAGAEVEGSAPDLMTVAGWRWDYLWPAAFALLAVVAIHVCTWRRAVVALYTGSVPPEPLLGDRLVENLRTHGPDPRYRKSIYASIATHLAVIVIPMLLQLYGCVQPAAGGRHPGRPQEEEKEKALRSQPQLGDLLPRARPRRIRNPPRGRGGDRTDLRGRPQRALRQDGRRRRQARRLARGNGQRADPLHPPRVRRPRLGRRHGRRQPGRHELPPGVPPHHRLQGGPKVREPHPLSST